MQIMAMGAVPSTAHDCGMNAAARARGAEGTKRAVGNGVAHGR